MTSIPDRRATPAMGRVLHRHLTQGQLRPLTLCRTQAAIQEVIQEVILAEMAAAETVVEMVVETDI
jgi:hypothetical protein